LVYGSEARGQTRSTSDIDLILVTRARRRSATALRELVSDLPGSDRLQLQVLTQEEMTWLFNDRPDFAAHLVQEGIVVYDRGEFLKGLLMAPIRPIDSTDYDRLVERARRQTIFERFNGRLLFALARLYSVGKAVVMLSLVQEGKPEFDRHRAFSKFRHMHPDLAPAVDRITRLEPFYLRVRRRRTSPLPFDPSGPQAPTAARLALESVKQIAASA
jgi:hypothetical protein